jgi:hypothetical protein
MRVMPNEKLSVLAAIAAPKAIAEAAMREKISPAAVDPKRKKIALVLAALADAIQIGGWPAFIGGAAAVPDDVLDGAMVILLTLILGFRWRLLFSLALELTPFATLLPSWTAVVASLPVRPTELPPSIAEHSLKEAP